MFEDLRGVVGSVSQSVLEEICNTVYRTAFLDVPIKVRDIRNAMDEFESGSSTDLSVVVDLWLSLDRELARLPLPASMY